MPNKYERIMDNSSENEGHYASGSTTVPAHVRTQDDSQGIASGDILLLSPAVIDDGHIAPIMGTTTTMKLPVDTDEEIPVDVVDLTHEDDKAKVPLYKRLTGILAVLFATILTSLNNEILYYIFDKLKVSYSKSLFLTWSYFIYCVLNYVPLQIIMYNHWDVIVKPVKDDKRILVLLAVRGILGSSIQFVTSHAIDHFCRPAPVSVITAMAPIFVYINAYFVLKEKLGLIPIINIFVAIGGVVVMNLDELTSHHEKSNNLEGSGLAFTAMLILSWVTVIVRVLRNLNPLLLNMSFGVCGVIIQGCIVLYENKGYWLDRMDVLGICFASAVITAVGNFAFNIALKFESAGVVSLIRTSEVVFSFFFQFCFFGIRPDVLTALGGAMIIFGVICVTVRKIVSESSETSKMRKYLWFLLY